MKKGFVVTIDAILALIIFLFFINLLIKLPTEKSYSLNRIGMDITSVLEKKRNFNVNEILTPDNVCVKIDVYENYFDESNLISTVTKFGCAEPMNEIYTWRTFYNGSFYIIRATLWYK